jgi:hypothetical protein
MSGSILENVMDGETPPPVQVNMASMAPPSAHGVVMENPVVEPTASATVVTIAIDCVWSGEGDCIVRPSREHALTKAHSATTAAKLWAIRFICTSKGYDIEHYSAVREFVQCSVVCADSARAPR